MAKPDELPSQFPMRPERPILSSSTTPFQCSECSRISNQPDFDCGCVVNEPKLKPLADSSDRLPYNKPDVQLLYTSYVEDIIYECESEIYVSSEWLGTDSGYFDLPCPVSAPEYPVRYVREKISPYKWVRNCYRSGQYRIRPDIFEIIEEMAYDQGIIPDVDAFSSEVHSRLPIHWSAHSDAFTKDWANFTLWINPPIRHIHLIAEKIYSDEARGIILIPVRPKSSWFRLLSYITFRWFDFPRDASIFEDTRGRLLPPWVGTQFRLCFSDALRALDGFEESK